MVKLFISIMICQAAGFIGSFFTRSSVSTWYQGLIKPSFAPPNWLFAPVWITIFIMMGISLYLIIKPDNKKSVILTRILILIIGIVSIFFSVYITSVKNSFPIITSLLVALTIFSGAFIIPTFAGILGYRVNKIQIITAILAGGLVALTGKIIEMKGMTLVGNIVIISAFLINAATLFFPVKLIAKK